MDIVDIKTKKKELEENINNLLLKFQEETDIGIEDVVFRNKNYTTYSNKYINFNPDVIIYL